MAEENSRFLDSLREANLLLLSRLHASQKAIWKDVKVFKSTTEPSCGNNSRNYGLEWVQFTGCGPNHVPVSLRSGELVSKRSQKSPVKGYESTENGFSTAWGTREKENTPGNGTKMGLSSILRTPQSRRKKQVRIYMNLYIFLYFRIILRETWREHFMILMNFVKCSLHIYYIICTLKLVTSSGYTTTCYRLYKYINL